MNIFFIFYKFHLITGLPDVQYIPVMVIEN